MARRWLLLAAVSGGAIVLLPLAGGHHLPFVDLVAFTALNNYPARLSSGPDHFYSFSSPNSCTTRCIASSPPCG